MSSWGGDSERRPAVCRARVSPSATDFPPRRRSSGPKPAPPGTNIPQSRESLPQEDDLLLLPPMIRPWGKGSGLRSAAPCLMGRGRVRRVRLIGPARNRCRLAFATCSSPGERGTIRATMTSVSRPFGGDPGSSSRPNPQIFAEPGQLSSTFPANRPLPRRAHQEGFDLPAARARRTPEPTTLRLAAKAPLDRLQISALAAR